MRSAIVLTNAGQRQDAFKQAVARQFDAWKARRIQRKRMLQLRSLSDHTLKDIGVHRSKIASVVIEAQSGTRS